MNKLKNEQGYALITVLLIITIFMILILSFTGQSISSMKQNNMVEKSSQSVAIAEMGITYYQTAVQNVFKSNQTKVNEQVKALSNLTKSQVATIMRDYIKSALDNGKTPYNVDNKTDTSFKVDYDSVELDPNNSSLININFTVSGTKGTKVSTLTSTMTLDLQNITITTQFNTPSYNEVPFPQNLASQCINPTNFTNINLTTCPNGILINTPMTYSDNYNGYTGTIYSTSDLTLGGNGNKSSLTIHADSLSLNGNLNSITNLTLETNKNATFGGQLRVDGSDLYIGGILSATAHVDIGTLNPNNYDFTKIPNSRVMVRGTGLSSINDSLTIDSGSIMCVNGDLSVKGLEIQSAYDSSTKKTYKGQLIIKGNLTINGTLFTNNSATSPITGTGTLIRVTNSTDPSILQQCENTFDTSSVVNTIDWGNSTSAVVNTVTYN